MDILNIEEAIQLGHVSEGSVYINAQPDIRHGKRNDYMMGNFLTPQGSVPFKIWEERIFAPVRDGGPGIYDVVTEGSEYNGIYLTVRTICPTTNPQWAISDFLPSIDAPKLSQLWQDVRSKLKDLGVSAKAWQCLEKILADPEINGRYVLEGAAIYYHDNKIGGLLHHTGKMLNILAALLENCPSLQDWADLLFLGIALHDVGKVFEYKNLSLGEYWYANHRVRGIELLSKYKDDLMAAYNESFYRQLQSIIIGHHGDFGDRPTTVAAGIVHYIDSLDSQVTGMLESLKDSPDGRIRFGEWGWLAGFPPVQA